MMMSTLSHILRALRNDAGTGVHGTDISQKLGISRAAVWSHIEELRSLGYGINAGPHKGYRLTEVPDILIADDLTSQLSEDQIIGNQIRVFRETASTNQLVDQIGLAGEPEGLVIFAESQTQGRGRLGRQWISPSKKGLWFSVLLRPALRPPQMTQLTVIAATALARAIRETTPLIPEIKWPNDIYLGGRKCGGILTETVNVSGDELAVIIGLGLNVAQAPSSDVLQRPATSLNAELEASVMIGRQLNLNRARELALAGDLDGMQREITSQIGSAAEFESMNVIQRQKLAAAFGVSVGELSKMVTNQDKLNNMTDSEKKKRDLENSMKKLLPRLKENKTAKSDNFTHCREYLKLD